MPHPRLPLRTLARRTAASSVALVLAVSGAVLVGGTPLSGTAAVAASAAAPGGQPATAAPTRLRVATFNVLGYGHTMPGGDRKGYADGRTRQSAANRLISGYGIEIVGFQEIESPQIDQFKAELGGSYDIWPGRVSSREGYHPNVDGNSIAWRKDQWQAVTKTFYQAPYFRGAMQDRPIVLLRNLANGQHLLVTNTHNPADSFGDAQAYRDQSVAIQAATLNSLRAQYPGVPILFTGDMNDTRRFFCPFVRKTGYAFQAANGGVVTPTRCTLPSPSSIDWILGTRDIAFSGYQQQRTPAVQQVTDHPLIWADATIRPMAVQAAGIRRVVYVDVEGLPSAAVGRNTPRLQQLRAAGASTLNARTTPETSAALPNLVSALTGRPVKRAWGGHGTLNGKPRTIRAAAGRYVRSAFDMVHDWGLGTSFMSSDPAAAIVRRSYNGVTGAPDTDGVSYGRNKLSVSSMRRDDAAVTQALRRQLSRAPRALSVVQLSAPRTAGSRYGFFSKRYFAAVRRTDRQIGLIRRAIARNPATAHSTLLVVTGDSGGKGRRASGRAATNWTVPFVAWGNGVPASTDLYALNPAYGDPGAGRVSPTGAPPVRPGNVANLVTSVLGLPPVGGSTIDTAQNFNVFVRP